MTTGQRIAAKRKELSLSQEALGERLGVSRQSIYKWESDSSLPEIEKLIAMSRLFSVSVGWLLGVEEEKHDEPTPPSQDDGELNDIQIKMVEEIVGRYLAAQPKPKQRKKWPYVLLAAVLFFAGLTLFDRLEQLDNRYDNLQNSIGNITSNVNSQISSITNRVEEVLKAQNDLTADYGCEIQSANLEENTITFQMYATPKTYVPGMDVQFLIDRGNGKMADVTATEDDNHRFSATLSVPLTDSISISAVFITGNTRQTQLLDNYNGLYSASLPTVDLRGLETSLLHGATGKDGVFHLASDYGWLSKVSTNTKLGTVEMESFQAGLFRNGQLLTWLTPTAKPENWDVDAEHFFRSPELTLELQDGDILVYAVIYTDEYGRQGVSPSIPVFECFGDEISWTEDSDATPYFDLSYYSFD